MFCWKSQDARTDIFSVPMNKEEVRYRLLLSLAILRKGMQNKGRVELVKHSLSDNRIKFGFRLQFRDMCRILYYERNTLFPDEPIEAQIWGMSLASSQKLMFTGIPGPGLSGLCTPGIAPLPALHKVMQSPRKELV